MKTIEKVVRDGKVAVLYSPGFGAGWYSWNTDQMTLLFHPKIVELVEQDKRELITDELMLELGFETFYTGGAEQLKIQWLPQGTHFRIDEYDGFESIITMDNIHLIKDFAKGVDLEFSDYLKFARAMKACEA